MRRQLHSLALATGLAALSACSGGGPGAGAHPGVGLTGGGGGPGFLELSVDAPWITVCKGERRVKLYYGIAPIEYVEEVAADGNGSFSVDVVQVVSPHPDPEMFIALQTLRETFTYRYRDFRIKNWNLFEQQYTATIVDDTRTVAGIATVQVEIVRKYDALSRYLVDFDPNTGFVLGYQEFTPDGLTLLAEVSFETFEYDADLTGIELVDHLWPTTVHDLYTADLDAIFEFEPLVPTYRPLGYAILDEIEELDAPNGTHAKVYLTDGLEMVVMTCRKPEAGAGQASPSRVGSMQIGPWTALDGDVNGYPVLMAGKISALEQSLVLQSAIDSLGK